MTRAERETALTQGIEAARLMASVADRARKAAQVRSRDWLGVSARTKAAMQKAAAGWGIEILSARWERVRKGGIMCGPSGGWAVEVRAVGGTHREVALGYRLSELYDSMEQAAWNVRYLDNAARAETPSAKLTALPDDQRNPPTT